MNSTNELLLDGDFIYSNYITSLQPFSPGTRAADGAGAPATTPCGREHPAVARAGLEGITMHTTAA
jgi:hypothetical protein